MFYKQAQSFEFRFSTQAFDTGAATDADSIPTFDVYVEGSNTPVTTGTECTKVTTGYYKASAACSALDIGKTYYIRVSATVSSVAGASAIGQFTVIPATVWDSLFGGTDTLGVDLDTVISAIAGVVADTEDIQSRLPAALVNGKMDSTGSGAGGAIQYTYTVYKSSQMQEALPDVEVWVSSDANGSNIIDGSKYTDDFGVTTWQLDEGTYYFWRKKAGYIFDNPDVEAITNE